MKTEDLTKLGLTAEQISEIQKLNGLDISSEQKKSEKIIAERDNYKGQLETTQNALKEFEGVDIKELKGKIDTLTADLTAKETDYQTKLTDMEFNSKLDGLITSSGARNAKTVKALLDLESIKSSKNQDTDLQTALETCKKDNEYLFGETAPIYNPIALTGGGAPKTVTGVEAMFLAKNPDIKI